MHEDDYADFQAQVGEMQFFGGELGVQHCAVKFNNDGTQAHCGMVHHGWKVSRETGDLLSEVLGWRRGGKGVRAKTFCITIDPVLNLVQTVAHKLPVVNAISAQCATLLGLWDGDGCATMKRTPAGTHKESGMAHGVLSYVTASKALHDGVIRMIKEFAGVDMVQPKTIVPCKTPGEWMYRMKIDSDSAAYHRLFFLLYGYVNKTIGMKRKFDKARVGAVTHYDLVLERHLLPGRPTAASRLAAASEKEAPRELRARMDPSERFELCAQLVQQRLDEQLAQDAKYLTVCNVESEDVLNPVHRRRMKERLRRSKRKV